MSAAMLSRPAEERAVDDFLLAASAGPSGLVIEGEAGIGKTTLWLSALDKARRRGFRVLSARAAAAESVLAHGSLADLLDEVDPSVWADLPERQRLGVDRILRSDPEGPASDQRALAAGFLAVVEALAGDEPVLIAIDDLQWLDPSSLQVIAHAARRLKGRVGLTATVRTELGGGYVGSWLQLPRPEHVHRITVPALTLGGLGVVVGARLGRSFPRPTMLRIHEASGGNPFYAIELAYAIGDERLAEVRLPGTLAGLVQNRIGLLNREVREALLAAACSAAPTVESVAGAIGRAAVDLVALLESAEVGGLLGIDGNRLRFTHPLLAHGVYGGATPAQRRAMHARLAAIVDEPELRARHLASAATTADPTTLRALDDAAEIARRRGAPAAAAELVDLAIGLGGDCVERRMRLARHLLAAGDSSRVLAILKATIDGMPSGPDRAEAINLLGFGHIFNDSLVEACHCFERALAEVGDHPRMRVQIAPALAYALVGTGRLDDARRVVDESLVHAERLGDPVPLSQALSQSVIARLLQGEGYDEFTMQRALSLEDEDADIPVVLRPRLYHVMALSWTGQYERARAEMDVIRKRCAERGEEYELGVLSLWHCQLLVWSNDFAAAGVVADESIERARLLGGDDMVNLMQVNRCNVAAYRGCVDQSRVDGAESIAAWHRNGGLPFVAFGMMCLGFLEVSLGDYDAALATLDPLILLQHGHPDAIELYLASFLPDAVEALIGVGRLDEAEPLIERLERNGRRLDRAWMSAMGARGRAMLLAAEGDLKAAEGAAARAMVEHDRLPMPFERARTQLLVGQLQRRRRQKALAATTLNDALTTFEELGTPLWAQRARAELARVNVVPGQGGLTPTEQRVAELAAAGMTNRDIAAALFISTKTVDSNLSRTYRKLGIRSRAQLGQHVTPATR